MSHRGTRRRPTPTSLLVAFVALACSDAAGEMVGMAGGATIGGAGAAGMSSAGAAGMTASAGVAGMTASAGSAAGASMGGTTGAGGMPSGGATAGAGAPSTGCDGAALIQNMCALAGCHLDAFQPLLVDDYVTVLKSTSSTICPDAAPYLDASNPAASYLIEKINPNPCGDPTGISGRQMPVTVPGYMTMAMSAEDIQCLTDWAIQAASQ